MKHFFRAVFVLSAFAVASCSGNFASGPSQPNTIPLAGVSPSPGLASNAVASAAATGSSDTAVVSAAESQSGLRCPTISGFSCVLRFNVPETPIPSPFPSGKLKKPSPSPSPTPKASPAGSGEPSPSPLPSGDTVTLKLAILPKDAPPLGHVAKDATPVTPLELLTMTPSANFTIEGNVVARFTLPHEQVGGRGFALQIFERTERKKKFRYRGLYSFNKSSLQGDSLDFSFKAPKITVPKGMTFALVLYGGDLPAAVQPRPSTAPSMKPSTSPAP